MANLSERTKKRKAFFASLGECITAWAAIERKIFDLFQIALGADREKSAILFWAFPTFGMRLSYTSTFVTQCLKTNGNKKTRAQKHWNALRLDIENIRAFRNKLVHQPIMEDTVLQADDEDYCEMIIWAADMIIPNILDKRQKFKPIELSDLLSHITQLALILERLKYFTSQFPALVEIALQTFSDIE
jgi:hypothetical protein